MKGTPNNLDASQKSCCVRGAGKDPAGLKPAEAHPILSYTEHFDLPDT